MLVVAANFVRAPRLVVMDNMGGALRIVPSSASIHLSYRLDPQSTSGHDDDESAQLDRASFRVEGRTIAAMAGLPSSSP